MFRVLMVSPGKKNTAGISPVILAYEDSFIWSKYKCCWVESYIDKNNFSKILYFFKSLFQYFFFLPGSKLIHIHFSGYKSMLRKSIYFYPAKLMKKKVIVHFHAYGVENTINGGFQDIYKNIFDLSDRIIVVSELWKKELYDFVDNGEKINVVYNPAKEICRQTDGQNVKTHKKKSVLCVASLSKRKGYIDLINAFASLLKNDDKFSEWKLIFVGGGEINAAKRMALQKGISGNVVFTGFVSENKKSEYLKTSSIFCLPTYAEGFPMAIVEAMAYGLPIITTPVGGIPDICFHKENSLLVKPGDIEGLKEYLMLLMGDENLRHDLGCSAMLTAKEKFDKDSITRQVSQIYDEILS